MPNGNGLDPMVQYARLSKRVENQGEDIVELRFYSKQRLAGQRRVATRNAGVTKSAGNQPCMIRSMTNQRKFRMRCIVETGHQTIAFAPGPAEIGDPVRRLSAAVSIRTEIATVKPNMSLSATGSVSRAKVFSW